MKSAIAHKQRVILLSQSDVKKEVNAGEPAPIMKGAHTATEKEVAIPRDQHSRGHRCSQIGPAEVNKFRNRDTAAVKTKQSAAPTMRYERDDLLARCGFEQKNAVKTARERALRILSSVRRNDTRRGWTRIARRKGEI